MPRYLTESDARALLSARAALEAVRAVFLAHGKGEVGVSPRERVRTSAGFLMTMGASWPGRGYHVVKSYTAGRQGAFFHNLLYDTATGRLVAILEANWLGELRTGMATAVGVEALARPGARSLAIIGSGKQAWTQALALATLRGWQDVRVYSRDPVRRGSFAGRASSDLGMPSRAVDSAREAVEGADVVVAMTTAREPVFDGSWVADGACVVGAGNNSLEKRELDETTALRSSLVAVDERLNARTECGDLLPLVESGRMAWEDTVELGAILAGVVPLPEATDPGLRLFESQGVAFLDLAVAAEVYEAAVAAGRGTDIAGGQG